MRWTQEWIRSAAVVVHAEYRFTPTHKAVAVGAATGKLRWRVDWAKAKIAVSLQGSCIRALVNPGWSTSSSLHQAEKSTMNMIGCCHRPTAVAPTRRHRQAEELCAQVDGSEAINQFVMAIAPRVAHGRSWLTFWRSFRRGSTILPS